jgi:hypothetical protein
VALDTRTRPARRPARRRLPQLTALILLTMAAGLWAWLFVPVAPAAAVAPPRLHAAATQVDAATSGDHATAADHTAATDHTTATGDHTTTAAPTATAAVSTATAARAPADARHGTPAGTSPAACGSRAPPVTS